MNKYRWICPNCEATNEADRDECTTCNCPASISAFELDQFRSSTAEKSPMNKATLFIQTWESRLKVKVEPYKRNYFYRVLNVLGISGILWVLTKGDFSEGYYFPFHVMIVGAMEWMSINMLYERDFVALPEMYRNTPVNTAICLLYLTIYWIGFIWAIFFEY